MRSSRMSSTTLDPSWAHGHDSIGTIDPSTRASGHRCARRVAIQASSWSIHVGADRDRIVTAPRHRVTRPALGPLGCRVEIEHPPLRILDERRLGGVGEEATEERIVEASHHGRFNRCAIEERGLGVQRTSSTACEVAPPA